MNLCSSHILVLSFSPQSKILWKACSRSLDSKWFTIALGNMRKRPAWILWSLRREASLGEREGGTADEEHISSPWWLLPSHTVGLSLIKIMPCMVIHPPNKFRQLVFERKCRVFPGLWISGNTYDHFNRETYQGLDSQGVSLAYYWAEAMAGSLWLRVIPYRVAKPAAIWCFPGKPREARADKEQQGEGMCAEIMFKW